MSDQGFGFRPGGDDDDDDGRRRGGDFGFFGFPLGGFGFGAPGQGQGGPGGQGQPNLGDILNQFGQMLSGMGQSMEKDGSALNTDVTARVARQRIGDVAPVRDSERTALGDALRLAELWLDEATTLPAGADRIEAWNSLQWLDETLPTWRRIVEPVAARMADATLEGVPEEARSMMGPMMGMMSRMNSMNFGAQLGGALAGLAKDALTGSDQGLPLHTAGGAVLLPAHLTALAEDLELPARELYVYAAAREAAHQRLWARVPWLAERMISSVEEYAQGLIMDYSHIEEASRGIDLEALQDPARMQEALAGLQNLDLTPKITSSRAHARTRLETLLSLIGGWVDVVVEDALGERLPGAARLAEAWRRRTAVDGAEQALHKATGIDLAAPRTTEAADLWRRLTTAVGVERRDAVWDHPDLLPVAEDLDDSAAFIDGVIGGGSDDGFDPIAELEEQLRREAESGDQRDDDARGRHDDGTADGND